MSEADRRNPWTLVSALALIAALAGVAWWLISTGDVVEPGGLQDRASMDAGVPVDAKARDVEAGNDWALVDGSLVWVGEGREPPVQDQNTVSGMDGAVQLHLPPRPRPPNEIILTPEELRDRRSEQIELIEDRIAEIDRDIQNAAANPNRALLESRRERLIERRDTLIGTLLDPTE